MKPLSLRQAVRFFDVSRPTLTKALKQGLVSGTQDNSGNWSLDPSELARVYAPRTNKPGKNEEPSPVKLTTLSPENGGVDRENLIAQVARLEAELTAEREKRELVERHLADMRVLLPSPEARSEARPRRRWWP